MVDGSPAAVVDRRIDTLRALDTASDSKAGLIDRVGVSRSTIDRALRELTTHGFVTATTDGYRLTLPGRLVLDEYGRRTRRIGAIADAAPLFDGIDLAFDIDPAVFDGATILESTPHAPNRPAEGIAMLVTDATHVSVYTARFLSRHARVYHDRVLAGMTGTFVATERVIDQQRATCPGDLREAVDLGRVAVRRTDRDDPVTLLLAETPDGPEMGLVVYRDDTPWGFVGNDDPAATRWARALHDRLWSTAAPI
ncbi:MAG: helix-turn-helix transcriptional regulator [Haloplanus sp.]